MGITTKMVSKFTFTSKEFYLKYQREISPISIFSISQIFNCWIIFIKKFFLNYFRKTKVSWRARNYSENYSRGSQSREKSRNSLTPHESVSINRTR